MTRSSFVENLIVSSMWVMALLLVGPVQAAELKEIWNIDGGRSQAPALVCPKANRSRPAAPSQEAGLAPPDADEIAALESIPDRSGATEPLPALKSPVGRPFSVAIWGDSHTAAGFFSEQLVESIGLSQSSVAPSFIPPTVGRPGVRLPIRASCRGGAWQTDLAYPKASAPVQFSRALARAEASGAAAYLWIDFRRETSAPGLKELEILFTIPDKSARATVRVLIDDAESRTFTISQIHDRILIRSRKPFSTMKLFVERGSLFLDGFVPTYVDAPKLVLDTLSIPGATARAWRIVEPSFLRTWGPATPYDFALLQYGTNEGNSSTFDRAQYARMLRESLAGFRAAYPNASCVLIGPTDRGVLVRRGGKKRKKSAAPSNLLLYARIHYEISQLQSEIGKEFGCAFWNWQRAMGGPGSMYRWQRAQPALAATDLIHLTKLGYQESARRFSEDMQLGKALAGILE